MKFVIRSCNSRKWYVERFLVPRLILLGIDQTDIVVLNDDECRGNLKSFIYVARYVCEEMRDERGVWILQDDVLPSSKFYEVAKNVPLNKVCNGFCCAEFNPNETTKIGYQKVQNYWMSFQATYFPIKYLHEFLCWFHDKCVKQGKWSKRVGANKYDDFFFWQFMKEQHPNDIILNIAPNIVQHVDYMIGGSVINKIRKAQSCHWNEVELEKELKEKIEVYRNGSTAERD